MTTVKHVDLGLEFVTQNGWKEMNLCGPACLSMLARWQTPGGKTTPLEVAALIPDRKHGEDTTYDQILAVAPKLGFTLKRVNPTVVQMTGELDSGRPFVADFIRNRIPHWREIYALDEFGPHLAIIDGYTLDDLGNVTFDMKDPLGFAGKIGDGLPVKSADLLNGMKATGYASTALFLDAALVPTPLPPTGAPMPVLARLEAIPTDADVQTVALAIIRGFETGGDYESISTGDAGLLSVGAYQMALSGGALAKLIALYIETGTFSVATMREYLPRVIARDATLVTDSTFISAVKRMLKDNVTSALQDQLVVSLYYTPAMTTTVIPRGLTTPLAKALASNLCVHVGRLNLYWTEAEADLKLPPHSDAAIRAAKGVTEAQVVTATARHYLAAMTTFAKVNPALSGVVQRAEWFYTEAMSGDFGLHGTDGKLTLKAGVSVNGLS